MVAASLAALTYRSFVKPIPLDFLEAVFGYCVVRTVKTVIACMTEVWGGRVEGGVHSRARARACVLV